MAYVDLEDKLENNGDFVFTDSKRHKAYNLLNYSFPDMPEIGLDIAGLINIGASTTNIEGVIIAYLSDFKSDPHHYSINFSSNNGRLEFIIQYTPSEVIKLDDPRRV